MVYRNTDTKTCPSWFELEAYEYTHTMSKAAWLSALVERLLLRDRIESLDDDLPDSVSREECRTEIRRLFEEIKNKDVREADLTPSTSKGFAQPILMLGVGDVQLLNDLCNSKRRRADEFHESVMGNKNALARLIAVEEMPVDELLNFNSLDSPQTHRAYVHFDVSAPLMQLSKQFKEIVLQTKRRYATTTKSTGYNEVDYKNWANSQVLAYFDLTAWFQVEKQVPGYQNLGLMLFPEDLDITPSEKIRKVVKPLADKLISTTSIYAIWNSILQSRP